jgi:hypothetical protein
VSIYNIGKRECRTGAYFRRRQEPAPFLVPEGEGTCDFRVITNPYTQAMQLLPIQKSSGVSKPLSSFVPGPFGCQILFGRCPLTPFSRILTLAGYPHIVCHLPGLLRVSDTRIIQKNRQKRRRAGSSCPPLFIESSEYFCFQISALSI